MTAILSAWMAELVLESFGAYLYRRRSPLLSTILYFCAITDSAAYLLRGFLPATWIYFWGSWGQFYVKELMLVWLGCAICGMFAESRGMSKSQAIISATMLSAFTIAFSIAFCFSAETLKGRILAAEITADTILLVIIAVAWITGSGKRLPNIWKWITAGFLVMVGSDMLFTIGWFSTEKIRHFYPLGAIAAYLIWCIGPLRSARLTEFRQSLGYEIPKAQKVTVI